MPTIAFFQRWIFQLIKMSSIVKVPLFSHAKVLNHITDHKLVLKFRDSLEQSPSSSVCVY